MCVFAAASEAMTNEKKNKNEKIHLSYDYRYVNGFQPKMACKKHVFKRIFL